MTPGTLQTGCNILIAVFSILAILAGYGSYHFGEKAKVIESKKQQENQQIITSKLDEVLESTGNENRTKLLEKYPAGYVLFGHGRSSTFSDITFPHEGDLFTEYEFVWDKVKIEKLTSTSITILMPTIHYKPLNTLIMGSSRTIPRRPLGKEYILPITLHGSTHRIFVELLKDNNQQLIYVIGFRKTE